MQHVLLRARESGLKMRAVNRRPGTNSSGASERLPGLIVRLLVSLLPQEIPSPTVRIRVDCYAISRARRYHPLQPNLVPCTPTAQTSCSPVYAGRRLDPSAQSIVPAHKSATSWTTSSTLPITCNVVSRSLRDERHFVNQVSFCSPCRDDTLWRGLTEGSWYHS